MLICGIGLGMHCSSAWQEGSTEVQSAGDVAGGCPSREITTGVPVSATLTVSDCVSTDGPYYTHVYAFTGLAGQRVAISLTSASFDAFLLLIGPDGALVAEDDDGGGGLNARIPASGMIPLDASGVYRIEVSTFRQRQVGAYTLRMDSAAPVRPPESQTRSAGPFRFVPLSPCRLVDTRAEGGKTGAFGPPFIPGGAVRIVPVPLGGCNVASGAAAYSVNITVIPRKQLGFLIVYPAGQSRPNASTLNSFDGRVAANAAITSAGSGGAISIYVTDDTDVVVDINGYLVP